MSELTRLVLVRHGEAVCNVERRAGGPKGCTGLSDLGRRQAEALRDRLTTGREVQADVLYASTLPRAMETAELVAEGLGGLEIVGDDDLHELRPGEADGLTWEEIDALIGGPIDVEAEPDRPIAPGAESWTSFRQRVERVLGRIIDAHPGETAVVVAHGGIVDGALGIWFGLSPLGLRTINTSLTELVRERGADGTDRWLLARYNDAAHLAGIEHRTGYPA